MPQIALPDGRVLGYREYGAPDGRPVLCNHGGLLCGQDVSPADAAARALGLRLVSPDRPGIGASTQQRGRRTADWAVDVAALADALELTSFGAFGWSLGGQYAMALGALLAPRTTAVVVVAGCVPQPPAGQMNATDAFFLRLSHRSARAAAAAFAAMRTAARLSPGAVERLTGRTLCASDRAALAGLPAGAFAEWMATAMAAPRGMVEEYLALGRPWGFEPADIEVPVTFWQGGEDTLVAPQWAERLHDATPGAVLRRIPGDGHFLAYQRWHEVLAAFAAA